MTGRVVQDPNGRWRFKQDLDKQSPLPSGVLRTGSQDSDASLAAPDDLIKNDAFA